MLQLKLIAATITVCTLASGSRSLAEPDSGGSFLATTPGVSVEYLIVGGSRQHTAGNLETISVSKRASDGQIRTQTSAVSDSDTLVFGSRIARPSGDGYVVTSTTRDGSISERRFIRTTVANINAAIVALSASVNRNRIASDRQAVVAQLRAYSAMSAEDAGRLTQAQLSVANAATALNVAQLAADRLAAVARRARAEANAKIDESGVSFAQNQSREAAMKVAADADESANAAQRQADLAGAALVVAKGDIQVIRAHIAMVTQRTRALATRATAQDPEGR